MLDCSLNFALSVSVLSKTMANRLEGVLAKVISPFQGAFVKGRNIAYNNIIVALEVLHFVKTFVRNKSFYAK